MSSVKLFFIFLLVTSAGIVAYVQSKPTVTASRFANFAGAEQSIYTNRGVVERSIQIELSSENLPNGNQQITAEIKLAFDHSDALTFKWGLGENVKIVSGELEGKISNFESNRPKKIQLLVNGFTESENRHINFEVLGEKNNRRLYGDSLLASKPETTFENTVQNVERIKASRLEKNH